MDKLWYIAIQANHWGRGESEKQAKSNMRGAGGKGRSSVYAVRQADSALPPYVDGIGALCHFGVRLDWVSGKDVLGVNAPPLVLRRTFQHVTWSSPLAAVADSPFTVFVTGGEDDDGEDGEYDEPDTDEDVEEEVFDDVFDDDSNPF